MTSSSELAAVLRGVKGFRGVFASDTLPYTLRRGESVVVNFDPADRPGSHWVAMLHAKDGSGLYFDSFGQEPDAEDGILGDRTHFRAWLGLHTSKPLRWNHTDLQSLYSNTCGEWAATFVLIGALPQDRAAAKYWRPLQRGSAFARDARIKQLLGLRGFTRQPASRLP